MSNEITTLDLPEETPAGLFVSKKFRLMSFFGLLFLMVAVFCYTQGFFDKKTVQANPLQQKLTPSPTSPTVAPQHAGFAEIAATVGPDTNGQIRQLTAFQAERQLAEAERKVRELNKDIAELGLKETEARLKAQKPTAIPQIVVAPAQPQQSLSLPEASKTEPSKARGPQNPSAADVWKVVSIQGVNDSITATVSNGKGKSMVIQPGGPWNGGKIISITRNGVTIMRDGHSQFLSF